MLGGDPVLQRFNATHNVSVPQPVPDSMAAVNVFELFEAQLVARHGGAMETTLAVVIIGLLAGILVNVLMMWGAHIEGRRQSQRAPVSDLCYTFVARFQISFSMIIGLQVYMTCSSLPNMYI